MSVCHTPPTHVIIDKVLISDISNFRFRGEEDFGSDGHCLLLLYFKYHPISYKYKEI